MHLIDGYIFTYYLLCRYKAKEKINKKIGKIINEYSNIYTI